MSDDIDLDAIVQQASEWRVPNAGSDDIVVSADELRAVFSEFDRLRDRLTALTAAVEDLNECETCHRPIYREDGWPEVDHVPMRTFVVCGECSNAESDRLAALTAALDAADGFAEAVGQYWDRFPDASIAGTYAAYRKARAALDAGEHTDE